MRCLSNDLGGYIKRYKWNFEVVHVEGFQLNAFRWFFGLLEEYGGSSNWEMIINFIVNKKDQTNFCA